MKKIFSISLLALILFSCKRYSEGGFVSKTEKHLVGKTWKLEKYLRNNQDETTSLLVSNWEETYSENGSLLRTYSFDGQNLTQSGTWEFIKDEKYLKIDGVGSMPISAQVSSVSSSSFHIVRLKKDEFWYSFENGSDLHTFHFVEK